MPVPEEFLLSELWFAKNMGTHPAFVDVPERVLATPIYTNMAMLHRLCPAIGLTPIPSAVPPSEIVKVVDWNSAKKYTQSTHWIYQRGMDQLQESAVWSFNDIPVRSSELTRNPMYDFPVGVHEVTTLKFEVGSDRAEATRPTRKAPFLETLRRYVVFPCCPDQKWGVSLRPKPTKEKVNYAIRRRFDGEVHRSNDDLQPEVKDSRERMQDMAEEPEEAETNKPHNVGSTIPFPINNAQSRFEETTGSMAILSKDSQQGRQQFECTLCRTIKDKYTAPPIFYRLSQLNEHVKNSHDVIMYSTSVYTVQQILCG